MITEVLAPRKRPRASRPGCGKKRSRVRTPSGRGWHTSGRSGGQQRPRQERLSPLPSWQYRTFVLYQRGMAAKMHRGIPGQTPVPVL